MFDPGSSAGGTISSSGHDLEMLTALRFGSRFVDRQIHCENCQLYRDRTRTGEDGPDSSDENGVLYLTYDKYLARALLRRRLIGGSHDSR